MHADTAREAARRPDGKFGEQQRAEETGVDLAGLAAEAEDAVRAAYEAGQRDAYARAADLIHECAEPSSALLGHTMRHPEGAYEITVPDECGYEMADKVLSAASDSLRAYASGEPGRSATITCTECSGSGGDDNGNDCWACGGACARPAPGADAVTCCYCAGSGQVARHVRTSDLGGYMRRVDAACPVCAGGGKMAPTPSGQDEVFVPAFGRFHRSRIDEGSPPAGDVYAMRFEANRPLSDAETQRLTQLVGYRWRASVGGESVSDPTRDSDRSFCVSADSTKGRGYIGEFEEDLDGLIVEGSPIRKTDRAGAGTKGTRLVEGLGDSGLEITVYYDSEPS